MERAALAALDDVPTGRIRLHCEARAFRTWVDDDGGHVRINDPPGRCSTGDVLIGADGIHSAVRADVSDPSAITCALWECALPHSSSPIPR